MNCHECGEDLNEESRKCKNCGTPVAIGFDLDVCPKCNSNDIKNEDQRMSGGSFSRGHSYDVYVCQKCSHVLGMYKR